MDHTARPRYLTIAAELRARIERGELAPGDRVPSTRAIVREWGVAMATATRVISTLRLEGLVETVPGVGTIVLGRPDPLRGHGSRPVDQSQVIINEGVQIADSEGIEAVTLRRVAVQTGLAPVTLLQHFSDREDLVRRMTAAVVDAAPLPRESRDDWRSGLGAVARTVWAVCTEHPWLAGQLSITRPEPTRGGLQLTERALASLDGTCLSLAEMIDIHLMVINYVRGSALSLEAEIEAAARTGLSRPQWMSSRSHRTRTTAATAHVPLFNALETVEHDVDLEAIFELGLERLLDGIGMMLDQVRSDRPQPAVAPGSRSPDESATVSMPGTDHPPAGLERGNDPQG